ncbi:MAG: alpha/beta hydrolase [Chloroflexi bacterium]|nr:alpha/beta hydrolase [Chloroflexota bacterium]
MPKIRANGIDIYYEVYGAGEPLMLIMGLGADCRQWAFVLPALAQKYKVIVFDNRGAGQTDKPETPYSIPLFASDTAALLDALDIDKAHILGASMGGMIAQELAISHPERAQSLILACTFAKPDNMSRAILTTWRMVAERLGPQGLVKTMFPWGFTADFYENHAAELEMAEGLFLGNPQPLHAFLNQCDACLNHDTTARLPQISVPTLVMVAREDILTPPRLANVLYQSIPGAKLAVLESGGHVFLAEAPDKAAAAILEFLGSL